jgi:ribosome silencing factor RsfS/YbeB/iojap
MPVPRKINPKKKASVPKRRPSSSGPARKAAPASRGSSKSSAAPGARSAEGAKRSGFSGKPAHAAKRPGANARSPRAAAPQAAVARDGKRELLRKLPVLRKPTPRSPVDVGIGAVEIAPPKDAPRTIGIAAAEAAMDKKAFDVVVLDVRGISGLCDEMVVASARSVTHLSAVCDGVEEALRKQGERVLHSDGRHAAEPDWILLDYGDLMVHLFRPEARLQTRLEDYYASARLVAKWKND